MIWRSVIPVSSVVSRSAVCSSVSPSSGVPLGKDQVPDSCWTMAILPSGLMRMVPAVSYI